MAFFVWPVIFDFAPVFFLIYTASFVFFATSYKVASIIKLLKLISLKTV